MPAPILLVGQALGGGGAESRFRILSEHLFDGNVDVAVLSAGAGTKPTSVVDLGWDGRLSYAKVLYRLRRLMLRGHYDCVMSFGMFPNILSVLAARSCRQRPRIIISEITRPVMQAKASGRLRGVIYLTLQRLFYPLCDRVTANSIDGLVDACELAAISRESGRRVPNVISMDELKTRAKSHGAIPMNVPYFVCVSRFDRMKRIDTVIEAWSMLREGSDVSLVLVGDGVVRGELEAQVCFEKLDDRVVFLGALANPIPVLAGAKALILASEYEGFSNSVLEAMCLDVPVITSLCSSDAAEMCERGAALGFRVGDAEQLVAQVSALLGSTGLAGELVASARTYRAPHLLPAAIWEYERVIRETANEVKGDGGDRCAA